MSPRFASTRSPPYSNSETECRTAGSVDRLRRQEQERMIAQLVAQLGVDLLVGQVGERVAARLPVVGRGPGARHRRAAEADPAGGDLLRREDPVEAVERALVQRGVVLERAR